MLRRSALLLALALGATSVQARLQPPAMPRCCDGGCCPTERPAKTPPCCVVRPASDVPPASAAERVRVEPPALAPVTVTAISLAPAPVPPHAVAAAESPPGLEAPRLLPLRV